MANLQVAKNCRNEPDCMPDYDWYYLKGTFFRNLSSSGQSENYNNFILSDGTVVNTFLYARCPQRDYACMDIYVDVNGPKKPNILGRDIFGFKIYPHTNDIVPMGFRVGGLNQYNHDAGTWNEVGQNQINIGCRVKTNLGETCAAKIVLDGYQMNY